MYRRKKGVPQCASYSYRTYFMHAACCLSSLIPTKRIQMSWKPKLRSKNSLRPQQLDNVTVHRWPNKRCLWDRSWHCLWCSVRRLNLKTKLKEVEVKPSRLVGSGRFGYDFDLEKRKNYFIPILIAGLSANRLIVHQKFPYIMLHFVHFFIIISYIGVISVKVSYCC